MSWRFLSILAALAALTPLVLTAQDLVRLPPPPVDSAALREAARLDSIRIATAVDTVSDTVIYSAPRIRFRGDRFSLSGGALLKYKASTLRADSIMYYSDDDVVDAFGAPTIEDPSNPSILGYRMRYNLKNRVGTLYYGSSEKDGQTFNGVEVRRQPSSEIYIARGDLSTCDEKPDQHYYFYARRMIVQPEAQVLSGPIVMNIADVPLAVLPMMVMPLGKGRRSGLLQPKFGGDQSQGYYLEGLGYYWAISDYQDFNITTNIIEGSSGTFENTNLNTFYQWNKRYVWSGTIGTQVFLPEFQPSQAAGILDFSNDLNLTPDGRQTLKGQGRLQSSANVARNNALNEEQALEQTANASLGYRRQFDWNQSVLNVGLLQNYNLSQNHIDRNIPDISFQASGPLVPESEDDEPSLDGKDPWYRSWTWSYNNRFNVNQVIRPTLGTALGDSTIYAGYSDQASLSGKYSLGYVNLTPTLNGSQFWSAGERTGNPADPYRTAVDPANGEYGQYFAAWNASVGADTRIYGLAQAGEKPWLGRYTALRHTITPSVTFTYAPEIDSNPAFLPNPKIGGTAYQAKQQAIGIGISNDFDVKSIDPGADSATLANQKPVTKKILTTSSGINYNFASEVRPWSDLSSSITSYAFPVPVTFTATHRVYDDYADSAALNRETSPILQSWNFGWRKGLEVGGGFSTGLRVRDTRGLPTDRFEHTAWSASFNYGVAIGATRVGSTGDDDVLKRLVGASEVFQVTKTHQAGAGIRINPTREWKMSYDTEYNFTTGEFSRHAFGFERTLHCWQMVFHWNPVGVTSGWDFVIRIIDLPDIKLETRDSRSARR